MSWKKVKLGDILTESKVISENPNPDRRITVRLKVLGVEKRGLEKEVEGATKQYIRKAGQFIYGKQNFHKGAFGIVPTELDGFESSSDLPAFDVDESCLPEFIFYFFKQGNFYLELSKIASGVATQRINTTQLFELELLLPDIQTQRKLIENIQLLEKNGSKISTELTHQLNLVKKLRQQLLQDAVQGKLLEQNPKDEPASELLKKIKAEKQKLISEKKLKKEKELPPINPEEIPFEIPKNWVWCRLGDVVLFLNGYAFKSEWFKSDGIPLLRNINLGINELNWNDTVKLPHSKAKEFENYFLNVGDIILSLDRPIINAGLKIAQIKNEDLPCLLLQRVLKVTPFLIDDNFLYKWFNTRLFIDSINPGRSIGIPHISHNDVAKVLIPIPPFNEQRHIGKKLDEIMQYCNDLEESIKQSEAQNEKLLQQVLREALRKEPVEV